MTKNFSEADKAHSTVPTELDRKAFVRDWIARRLTAGKIAGSGLVGTLLTLPMLAAAQTIGEFVSAAQIDGVTNVRVTPDGSARLTMSNGTTISVPATDVRIAANGEVLVSDRIADFAAEVLAAGGGGGGLGGGGIIAALAGAAGIGAAAAGGGGGGEDDDGPAPLPVLNGDSFTSQVLGVSGGFNSQNTEITVPQSAATVEITITDGDGNETTLPADFFDANGDWTFTPTNGIPQGPVTVTVTSFDGDGKEIDSDSNEFNIDTIPPSIAIDTPIAGDGVLNIVEQAGGITITGTTDAENGRIVTVTVGTEEFTTTVSNGVWSVVIPAAGLAGLTDGAPVNVTANVADAAGNPATEASASFNTDLSAAITITTIAGDPVASADITAADRVGGFDVTGTVTGIEDGRTVTVMLNGQPFMAAVSGGAFTVPISEAFLGGLNAGPVTLTLSASVTDLAGNTASDTPAPIAADFTGPSIAIDPIRTANADGTLNIAESLGSLEITGTTNLVEAGRIVTVTVNGVTLAGPVTVGADGTWTASATPGELSGLPTNGTVNATANVSDAVGLAAPQATAQFDTDLDAPAIAITDTGVGTDGVLNISEQGAGVTITGTTTAENGQTVTILIGAEQVITTALNGAWSVVVPATGLASLSDGATVSVTANVADVAGNPATEASDSFAADLAAPTIAFDAISGDNQIGLLDVQGDLIITGTTDAEVGQTVVLTFNGTQFNGTVTGPNAWSVTVPQTAVQAVQAGAVGGLASVNVTATVTDAAGNPAAAPAAVTVSADFNGPSITIDPITGDNIINIVESGGDIIISGSTNNVPTGQDITVRVDGTLLGTATRVTTDSWQITLPQADLPANGASLNITADVSDGETAAPTASVTLSADLAAPTISITPVSGDDILNIAESAQPLVISGTSNAEEGQIVTLTVPGVTGPVTATVDASENWQVTLTAQQTADFVAGQDGQTPSILANVSDVADNPAVQAARPVAIDVSAPVVTIATPVAGDGVLNIAESGADLELSGTVTGADAVTVTFNGTDLTGVVVTGTTWTVDVPAATLQALASGATVEITASATDTAGNVGQAQPASITTDLQAPTIAITTPIAGDNLLNIAENQAGISVSGTTSGVEDGQSVSVTLSGNAGTPVVGIATVTGNAFTANFTTTNLAGIGSSNTATVTAVVSDRAGNPALPGTETLGIDLVAPTIAFADPPPSDFVLGVVERDSLEADGVAVTTTEPDGTPVTMTFTRPDGSGGTVTDVTINTTVSGGGTFDIALTPAQIAALEDQTTYTLDLAITDAAGNTGAAQLTVPTDFQPILTLDAIGVDGAFDLSDTAGASISGTTIGVEPGQQVTVIATGTNGEILNATAAVAADGTWTLPVGSAVLDQLEAGETFTVNATVSNAAGRAATPASADIDAYEASLLLHANSATAGSTLTIAAFGNDGFNSNDGFRTDLTFDPAETVYIAGSASGNSGLAFFIANDTQAGSGTVVLGGGSLTTPLPEGSVVYQFDMTDQGAGPITLNFQDQNLGGPSELLIGTSGADTLTANNIDSVIQGKGGDDSIDVSATGTNIVVFELDQATNGTDTVTGFTTGNTFQADQIVFLGEADVRGDGVQAVTAGQTLFLDTSFVVFTTALADTNAATIETAFEGLVGESFGETFYFLAGDGADAALALVTVNGSEDATIEVLANFIDIGDLGALNLDNIAPPDPAVVT